MNSDGVVAGPCALSVPGSVFSTGLATDHSNDLPSMKNTSEIDDSCAPSELVVGEENRDSWGRGPKLLSSAPSALWGWIVPMTFIDTRLLVYISHKIATAMAGLASLPVFNSLGLGHAALSGRHRQTTL